jgi:hypothetical protein
MVNISKDSRLLAINIRHAAEKLPFARRVILATDNDAGGDLLVRFIRDLLAPFEAGFEIMEDRPDQREADWNDILRNSCSVNLSGV